MMPSNLSNKTVTNVSPTFRAEHGYPFLHRIQRVRIETSLWWVELEQLEVFRSLSSPEIVLVLSLTEMESGHGSQ